MSLNEDRAAPMKRRGRGVLLVIAAAAFVFATFVISGRSLRRPTRSLALPSWRRSFFALRTGKKRKGLTPPLAVSERTNDPLRAIVGGLPDPVIALDRDGRVLALNEPARALAPALRQGEPVSLALRMPELDRGCRPRLCAMPSSSASSIPSACRSTAGFRPSRCRSGALRTPPQPDLVLLTFRDLTPLRRVEEMRADFVANASHELRTPLAALSGFIETLQGSARDDTKARERFLAIMQQQASRMARLIDDLLSLSRIELNAHRRPDTPVDLVPIVRQVADGLQTLARDRGVTVNVEAVGAADGARRP